MKEALFSSITNLDRTGSINITEELLQNKTPPQEILDVGRRDFSTFDVRVERLVLLVIYVFKNSRYF